jgi:hypothetical protein
MTDLTHVDVLWFKKRIENWIRFGRIAEEKVVDRNRRSVSFVPGSIFALVRWASNDYGPVASRIDILRAVRPGERYSTVPYVRPGGEILLRLSGWQKVEKVLQAIDAVEALGIDRLTPRRSIGITSITVCLSASSRDPTRAAGIRLGCSDRKFRHDEPLRNAGRHDHRRRRRDAHNGCQADAAFRVERVRKRAARAVQR